MSFEPNFIGNPLAAEYYQTLIDEVPWREDEIRMYGKWVAIPRLQQWYGDPGIDYTYSGLTLSAMPWHPVLASIKHQIEQLTGWSLNACLVNCYRDGNDTVGWHSDDEPELGEFPNIASVSLGDQRDFQMKHKATKQKLVVPLSHGSLLLMSGTTQRYWQHCVPRTKRVKSPRINLTFRKIFAPN
ncbi:alpha-ketoglutarate-dependent dioxygenase AlkB family protein [Thalassotalea euphylliae]|uniref:alpha-ketoglutarate-dependent dioxygenase AlkB family protein n=1 Tax=Thalassotalea euphylliae TaxID=1655234 RepID=UPI0036404CC9